MGLFKTLSSSSRCCSDAGSKGPHQPNASQGPMESHSICKEPWKEGCKSRKGCNHKGERRGDAGCQDYVSRSCQICSRQSPWCHCSGRHHVEERTLSCARYLH